MYVTCYMSRSQKFDVTTATDDKGELKLKIASAFDTVTIGLSKEQMKEVLTAIGLELGGQKDDDQEPPF